MKKLLFVLGTIIIVAASCGTPEPTTTTPTDTTSVAPVDTTRTMPDSTQR